MRAYDTYKDSGISWLGQIPSHWKVRRTKNLWQEVKEISADGKEQLLSVSQYEGITKNQEGSRSESLVGYKIVKQNNLVINIMLAWMGGLGVSQYNGLVSPAYCVYNLCDKFNAEYYHFLYRTPAYLAEFARRSTGVIPSRWRMYTDEFGCVASIIPPLNEQNAIVDYLKETTESIESEISQQQKMIDLLKERKQIIINEAVTRGLNPDVPMQETGIEWLPQIPAHWTYLKLKFLGTSNKKLIDPQKNKGQLFYEYSMPSFDNNKSPEQVFGALMESSKILLSEPTLLVNKLNVHKQRIWFIECPPQNSVASTEFIPFSRLRENPKYVEYYLLSDTVTRYLINNNNGTTNSQKRVSPEIIFNLLVSIPPKSEQYQIVDYIEKSIKPIDNAICRCERMIELLTERKQIVINDVVTGKVKVI